MEMKPTTKYIALQTPYFRKKDLKPKKKPRKEAKRKARFEARMAQFHDEQQIATNRLIDEGFTTIESMAQPGCVSLRASKYEVSPEALSTLETDIKAKLDRLMGTTISEPSANPKALDGLPPQLRELIEKIGGKVIASGPNGVFVSGEIEAQRPSPFSEDLGRLMMQVKNNLDNQRPLYDGPRAAKEAVNSWVRGKSIETIKGVKECIQSDLEVHRKDCPMKNNCVLEQAMVTTVECLAVQEQVNLQ